MRLLSYILIFCFMLCASCGQKPAQTLDLPVDVTQLGGNYLWPYGVHGGGHPEGHPGIDFISTYPVTVRAPADMTLDKIQPAESEGNVYLFATPFRNSSLSINFSSLILASGLSSGSRVKRGDVIGTFGPVNGQYMIHFGVLFSSGDVCPAIFFTTDSINLVGQDASNPTTIMGKASYSQKSSESKLCNPK